jgi:hypothetical protein
MRLHKSNVTGQTNFGMKSPQESIGKDPVQWDDAILLFFHPQNTSSQF